MKLIDTQSGKRGANAMTGAMNNANQQYVDEMTGALTPYQQAANIYNPLNNLDTFTQGVVDAEDKIHEGSRLGTVGATNEYLNPMMDRMMNDAMKRVQAGAGASGRSSAINNAIADRVAGMSGDMWNMATQQRQADSGIQTGAGKTTADIYNQAYNNWQQPSNVVTQGIMDTAGTMYNAGTAAAQGVGQLMSQNQGVIANALG